MPKFAMVQVPFAAILRRGVCGCAVRHDALFALPFFAISAFAPTAGAQTSATAAQPGLEPIRKYIAEGWDTLTRSLDECKSIVDTKMTTASVLYMPADFEVPPAVQKFQAQCNVEAKHLPIVIHNLGEIDESKSIRRDFCICRTSMLCRADDSTRCMDGIATSSFADCCATSESSWRKEWWRIFSLRSSTTGRS